MIVASLFARLGHIFPVRIWGALISTFLLVSEATDGSSSNATRLRASVTTQRKETVWQPAQFIVRCYRRIAVQLCTGLWDNISKRAGLNSGQETLANIAPICVIMIQHRSSNVIHIRFLLCIPCILQLWASPHLGYIDSHDMEKHLACRLSRRYSRLHS